MSLALRYISPEEAIEICEKLASVSRRLQVHAADLDKVVDAGLTAMLIQIEASRAAEADRRAKIKLVED
jgi:hypothetical protein